MPRLFGILNLSLDSFSDGGAYATLDAAIGQAERLVAEGAWAVDVGAVSSNPDGDGLSPEDELDRLRPVLDALDERSIRVSVDTFAAEVQRALAHRVAVLNDIRGFPDIRSSPEVVEADCQLVVMHALQDGRADRRAARADQIVERIERFFDDRLDELVRAGVEEDRLVLDPGMGFFLGDGPAPSVAVFHALPRLMERFDLPWLLSVSRKSFLGALLGGRPPMERTHATLAAEILASDLGVDYIRTHDVLALSDALTVRRALVR